MGFLSSTHAKPFMSEQLRIHLVLLKMCNVPSHLPTCPQLCPVFLLPKSISHHIPPSITRPLQALQGRQWAFICLTQGPTPSETSGWDNLVSTSSHVLRKVNLASTLTHLMRCLSSIHISLINWKQWVCVRVGNAVNVLNDSKIAFQRFCCDNIYNKKYGLISGIAKISPTQLHSHCPF